jgi:hypothetical protein
VSERLIILGVAASGLPLVVWWLVQHRIRYPWNGRPSEDPRRDWMRRQGLSADEAKTVADAVVQGEELPDGHLRDAAADWAEVLLRPGRPRDPRTRRILNGLLIVWLAAFAALVVWRVVTGHAGDVNWGLVAIWLVLTAVVDGRRRRVRRSLALNSRPSARSEDTA